MIIYIILFLVTWGLTKAAGKRSKKEEQLMKEDEEMSNYISAKQFLQQNEKVQKSLLDWCENNLQKYDLVKPINEEQIYLIDDVKDTTKDNINIGKIFYLGNSLCFDTICDIVLFPARGTPEIIILFFIITPPNISFLRFFYNKHASRSLCLHANAVFR
jgi:hypothetical protein